MFIIYSSCLDYLGCYYLFCLVMFPEFRLEFFFFMCLYSLIVAITSIATAKVQAILVEEYVT